MKILLPTTTHWTTATDFENKILAMVKIHHFCEERCEKGSLIDFIKCKSFDDIAKTSQVRFGKIKVCFHCEPFSMRIEEVEDNAKEITLKIGDLYFDTMEMLSLVAFNEGFNSSFEFIEYFHCVLQAKGFDKIEGFVVHWTDQPYNV